MRKKKILKIIACCLTIVFLTAAAVLGAELVLLHKIMGSTADPMRFLRTMNLLQRN